jgi:3D (Asp-Asp-Asp) domain-containing protein
LILGVCCFTPVAAYAPTPTKEEIREIKYQESLQSAVPVVVEPEVKQEIITEVLEVNDTEWIDVKVTAYDLSVRSCGKRKTHKAYGISRSGFNLRGHTRESAMAVAVDPDVIPLGSKIQIEFYNLEYQKYNGVYNCVDTGRLIIGNKIDLFMGDFGENNSKAALRFGVTEAKITIIKNEKEKFLNGEAR